MAILPFVDFANRSEKLVDRLIYEQILERNPLLAMLTVRNNPTLQEKWFTENSIPALQYRAENESYTDTYAEVIPNLMIFGRKGFTYGIDHQSAQVPGLVENNELTLQLTLKLKGMRLDLNDEIINANPLTDPREPLGIKGIIDYVDPVTDGVGSSEGEINLLWTGTGNNNGVNFGTDPKIYIQELNRLIRACNDKPSMILMNDWLLDTIEAVTVDAAANQALATMFKPKEATYTMNGRTKSYQYLEYKNIPLIDPGQDSQRSDILAFDETWGGSGVTTSMVAVVAGEADFHVVQSRPPVIKRKEGNELVEGRTLDYMSGYKYGSYKCLARMRGILQA
jgi:hypothetical protein